MDIKSFAYRYLVPEFLKQYRRDKRTKTYPTIKDATKVFPVLCRVKEGTWEEMIYPPLYGRTKEQYMKVYAEPQYAFEVSNAMVNCNSDIIVTEKGVYWDKYNDEEFVTWAHPADSNVLSYGKEHVTVLHTRRIETIKGVVLSLVGVYSYHWEHFLMQYACKMYYAGEKGLLNQSVTILYDNRGDNCILQFIRDFCQQYPLVVMKKAEQRVDYICEKLIAIPSTSPNFNDYNFRLDYPYFVSSCVIERIDKYAVKPCIEKIKDNTTKYEKIFLPRKGMRRTLTNYDEIHNYFLNNGFVDIEGAELSLEQKADIFYHAREIVGLMGGAEENLIFCNGARCLFLTNYKMSTQSWGYMQMRNKVSCWINVAGQDESPEYHSNFTIPLDKVIRAYKEYIHTDE